MYICVYVIFSEPSVTALWLVVLCFYCLCSDIDITGMEVHVILTYQLAKEQYTVLGRLFHRLVM